MTTNIKYSIKTLSNPFTLDEQGKLSMPGLILLGLVAGILHIHLRYPLSIPGHHGLEWMALLIFGRSLSTNRQAASCIAAAAAASYLMQSPFLVLAHDVKPALVFLLTGAATDLLYNFLKLRLAGLVGAGLTAGLAFITKPVVMYGLAIYGSIQVGSFIKHPDYLPFASHFLFGLTGGVLGALLARLAIAKKK